MTAARALLAARAAVENRRFFVIDHADGRGDLRHITLHDMKYVIKTATNCVPYPEGVPKNGGTCWRISGKDLDGEETTVGIEVVRDHLGNCAYVVTVF